MKIRTLAVAVLTLSMASAAFAQGSEFERGGMGGGNGTGTGMGSGTGTGNGPGGDGRGANPEIVVASDGTAFLARHLEADATGQFEVVAIRTSGASGWSYKFPALGPASLTVAGSNVIALQSGDGTANQGSTTPVAHTSRLTALSQASGSALWTLAIDGNAGDVKPFANGIYLTVTKPAIDSTGAVVQGAGVRSLVAVSNDGAILWTVKLN